MDTHWHVGEEIAAAEKEALPEARGSYRLFVLAQAGCDEFDTHVSHVGKVQTPPRSLKPVFTRQISNVHNGCFFVFVFFVKIYAVLHNKTIALRCTLQYFYNQKLIYRSRLCLHVK